MGLPEVWNTFLLVLTSASRNPLLLKSTIVGGINGFPIMPRYHTAWLSFPRQMVIVRDCGTGSLLVSTGIAKSIALGFASEVAIIKKVISRNARSTMAVRSIRGAIVRPLTFLPEFPEVVN